MNTLVLFLLNLQFIIFLLGSADGLHSRTSSKFEFKLLAYPKIALTRELGANDKLGALLTNYNCVEIPCIMFINGDDVGKLPDAIKTHDVIVITSPQAAHVFLESWHKCGKPSVKVASVGKGTSKPLISNGINVIFEPSDATAETLAKEIPLSIGKTVLYPSSAIAENVLVNGLTERGFVVTRLNTYCTVPAEWNDEQLNSAKNVDIVTFASPSAVKIWNEKVGNKFIAVTIGPTSHNAAEKLGFTSVFSPDGSKGVDAWANLIKKIASNCGSNLA